MSITCDLLIKNVHIASMQSSLEGYGIIENATVAVKNGKFVYVGSNDIELSIGAEVIDGQGKWLLPGLIDCHTHLVYGGDRSDEFEQRLLGVSYKAIAEQGGGIQSTVNATRKASKQQLLQSAIRRAKRLLEEGVTCIEIKSGYGLDLSNEIKMLEVAKELENHLPITVVTTFLGAHTVPVEFKDKPDAYVDLICEQMIPVIAAKNLATFVDVFCESIGFSLAQSKRVFECAKHHGLGIKAHVEQLSDLGGAKLACEYGASSVDHLEYLNEDDIADIGKSDTVAVILPGAYYYLNETTKPPIQALRQHQIPMAVATDLNPGSSPLNSLLTAMNMAAVIFGLSPEECLKGTTIHAAQALRQPNKGQIKEGMDADFSLWEIEHPNQLVYGINQTRPSQIWQAGKHV
jgi:imidazolonepropionase